jgi:hypothetical protein
MRSLPDSPLSGIQKALLFGGWLLHVGLPLVTTRFITQLSRQLPTLSWEFMTTLDYEWNIIQERIRFRWTIWVRNDSPIFFVLRYSSGKKSDKLTW